MIAPPKPISIAQRIAGIFRRPPVAKPSGQRNYAAAQVNRLNAGWSTLSASANHDIHRRDRKSVV